MKKGVTSKLLNILEQDECCNQDIPIYILATGQSNICGENDGSGDVTVNTDVKAWNGSRWVIMEPGVLPMGMFFPYQFSTEPRSNCTVWHFAKRIQKETQREVRVVLLGWGGNQIAEWLGVNSPNYSFIIQEMDKIGNPKIDYFVWAQGESNENLNLQTYRDDFDTVISQFRSEEFFPAATPIIVVGVIETTFPKINEVLKSICVNQDPFMYFADCHGLPSNGDGIHLSGESTVILGGERFFDALRNSRFKGQIVDLTTTQRTTILNFLGTIWPNSIVRDVDDGNFYTWDGSAWTAL